MSKYKNILVSVIMSTYNTPKEYLDISINSIINQSHKNLEIIIVCDGNEEEYNYINKNFKDKRIKLLLNKTNLGLAESLNNAISNCNGKYIARMDSDDISLKNRIITQIKFLEKHNEYVCCGMMAKCIGKSKNLRYKFLNTPQQIEIETLYMSPFIHPTVMFNKNKLLAFSGKPYNPDCKCSQDYELWSRLLNNKNSGQIKKIGLKYRIHNKQISTEKESMQKQITLNIINKNVQKYLNKNDSKVQLCFEFLGLQKEFNGENYIDLYELIEYTIKKNIKFDDKILNEVLYNRYFILILKRGLLFKALNNKNIRRKILTFNNINCMIQYLYFKIISILI